MIRDYENSHIDISIKRRAKIAMFIILLILLATHAFAASLEVKKKLKETSIEVGSPATILLEISNPFKQNIPLKIVDKNVIGNNGLDIQCLEYTLPPDATTTIEYNPITPFEEGDFSLGKAAITYTDPESKKEESIESNELKVKIEKSNATVSNKMQGITTLYQCNGQKIQSTSYSSSGSQTSMQISMGNNGIQNQMQQMQQPKDQMQQKQNSLQNNQMSQDTQALKQQMEKQMQEQKKMNEEFAKNLAKQEAIQQTHQQMSQQGYNLTDRSLNPTNNNTGDFQLKYQNQNGSTINVKGSLINGTIENLTKEDQKTVKMQKEKEKKKEQIMDRILNSLKWIIPLIVLLAVSAMILYRKLKKQQTSQEHIQIEEEDIDYVAAARKMLDNAKESFKKQHYKDAYGMCSTAIRFYFSHKYGIKKELTNSDLIKYLKQKRHPHTDVQKCLNLCGLVEFARYKATQKDFDEILSLAKKIIV